VNDRRILCKMPGNDSMQSGFDATPSYSQTPSSASGAADDKDMYEALHTLVDMIDNADETSKDDEETDEVISKIMGIVKKMKDDEALNEQAQPGSASKQSSQGSPQQMAPASKSPSKRSSGRQSPQTELPHYPTPYELWQKSHEQVRTETPKEKVARLPMDKRKDMADQCTDRLLAKQREEHFTMMKKQHKKLANELRGLTFVPDLSRTQKYNKDHVQSYEPLYKRYNYVTEMGVIKRDKMEGETRAAEMMECSFKPDLTVTQGPATPTRSAKVEDRCIQFGLEKAMWAQQRREIITRIENQSLTFSPSISARSAELYEEMKAKGKAVKPEDRIKKKKYEVPAGFFKPKINKNRQTRNRPKGSVYKRLYAIAKKKESARRKKEGAYLDKYVRNVPKPCSARNEDLPDEYSGLALSGAERSELRERGILASPTCTNNPKYVNVVSWDQKYSFITSQFPKLCRT